MYGITHLGDSFAIGHPVSLECSYYRIDSEMADIIRLEIQVKEGIRDGD